MAPPWVLDYVKMGLQHLAEEAARQATRRVLLGDAPPDPPEEYASQYKDADRVTTAQHDAAIKRLREQGFTDIHLPEHGVYYSQNPGGRWANHPYPPKGWDPEWPPTKRHISDAGCAPTSLAIATATLWGTPTTPPEVADFAVSHGYSSNRPPPKKPGGTDMDLIGEWAQEHQMNLKTTKSLDDLRDGLIAGGVAVVHVKGGIFNISGKGGLAAESHGHVIAVNGYAKDKDGKEWFFVANPGMDGRARKFAPELAEKGMVVDTDMKHHGAGMVRVSREVLEGYLRGKGAYILSKQT